MLACSVNTSSRPGDVITRTPTHCDVDAPVKRDSTIKYYSPKTTESSQTQKVQQQKWRQRSSARSNDSRVSALIITRLQRECPDGFQDPPAPIRIFIIDTSSPQHIGQMSWCPLPSSSSHHNSQLLEKKNKNKQTNKQTKNGGSCSSAACFKQS